jgi:hypothetical protein
MARLSLFLAIASLCSVSLAAFCHGKPDPNAKPNLFPINTDAPVFVKSVKNGHLYEATMGDRKLPIVHLYGTPYEMGVAQATLMGPTLLKFIDSVYDYIDENLEDAINGTVPWLPPQWALLIARFGFDLVLDMEIAATEPFTGKYIMEELQGLADTSGMDVKRIQRIHLFGELTKGDCSMFGAWGKAVPSSYSLVSLRALDWDMDGPFRDYPQITVYHPNEGNGHAFANVGFSGFIGSFSGMSSKQTATAEIGVSFPDGTFGDESRFGIPFTYILRDMLQFDDTLDDCKRHVQNANRTCNLILGFGDGKGPNPEFNGIQYSYSVANFQNDTHMQPLTDWHQRIPNVVYYGMDWNCPNYDIVLYNQLKATYGNITPEIAIRNITSIVQTGDLFTTFYDLTPANNRMFVSYASATNSTGPKAAYDRPFVRLDMTPIFNLPAPAL